MLLGSTLIILLTKPVKKWFDSKRDINETDLIKAAEEITQGVYEANLGGELYKKRIANSKTKGKSGGSRLMVAYKRGKVLFFMYAFDKNESDNISSKEKIVLKERAKIYFALSEVELQKAIEANIFYRLEGEERE